MRQIVETEDPEELSTTEGCTPDDNVDLLLSEVAGLNLEDLYPEPVHTFRLWQIFLERVNPLTKIIHVPSVQPYVVEAASNLQNIPQNVQALLFSIFTLAVISLEDAECQQILQTSKSDALRQFSDGARAALQKSQFLRIYEMPTLQALVMYLVRISRSLSPCYANIRFPSCRCKVDTAATAPGSSAVSSSGSPRRWDFTETERHSI
jgi:hypothetical protein